MTSGILSTCSIVLRSWQGRKDYTNRLAVYVDSPNRAVQEGTSKSTTTLLAERFVSKVRYLPPRIGWRVDDIADSPGFDYATYFNNFFQRHVGSARLGFHHGG